MTFFRGQKVVCVDSRNRPGKTWRNCGPVEGHIYTITGFVTHPDFMQCVTLAEIKRHPKCMNNGYCGYSVHRFRPVCDRPTDISQFIAMLNDKRVEVDA